MIDTTTLRANLAATIEAHRAAARAAKQQKQCDHEFKRFKETVRVDNARFGRHAAQFVTLGCVKCHEKRRVDYEVI